MNKIWIIGNLVRNVDVRTYPDGRAYGMFTIAENYGYGEQAKTNYFTCFLNNIGNVAQYLVKGTQVAVDGQMRVENTKNQDGSYITKVAVTVRELKMLGSKASNSQPSATGTPVSVAPQTPAPNPYPQQPVAPPPVPPQAQAPAYTPQPAVAPQPPVAPPPQATQPVPPPQPQAPTYPQQGGFPPTGGIADEDIPF